MIWSGQSEQRSIYDRFVVRYDGIVIAASDFSQTAEFLSQILDFEEIITKHAELKAFLGPDKRRLLLNASAKPVILVYRIKTSIKKLHQLLAKRFAKKDIGEVRELITNTLLAASQELPAPGLSNLITNERGTAFVTKDPGGNMYVFWDAKPFSRPNLTRLPID